MIYVFFLVIVFPLQFRLFELRKIVSNRESCYKLVPPEYPVEITKVSFMDTINSKVKFSQIIYVIDYIMNNSIHKYRAQTISLYK